MDHRDREDTETTTENREDSVGVLFTLKLFSVVVSVPSVSPW